MSRTLLVIDIQNDYFDGGAYPLVGADEAAQAASRVLAGFRERGEAVVHVQHMWDAPDATFMVPGTPGIAIHDAVRPEPGEALVTKSEPNAFLGTDLAAILGDAEGGPELVVVGMMTSMCVDSTVRSAAERGYAVQVVHEACAAPDLVFGDTTVPGAQVHAAFLAALDGSFATVTSEQNLA